MEKGISIKEISEMSGIPTQFFHVRHHAKTTAGYLRMCKILALNPVDYIQIGQGISGKTK